MKQYYFLASALPPLTLGTPPEVPFEEFLDLIRDNLTAEDYAQTITLRFLYDIQNMRSFWKNEPVDHRGNLNERDLEETLITRENLPRYVSDFLDAYESLEARLHHFPQLLAAYFKREGEKAVDFLKDYLLFEREWRLVFAAFRAKQLRKNLSDELQYEDTKDDLIARILAQKDAKTFIAPEGFEELETLFEEYHQSPLELYKALCVYRFRKIDELIGLDMFSLKAILGYMAKLITVEKWMELDQLKGQEMVKKVVRARD